MERAAVTSSNVGAIAFDASQQLLEVEFHPKAPDSAGDVWQYCPVPAALFERMASGRESVGKLLAGIKRDSSIVQRKVEAVESIDSRVTCDEAVTLP